MEAGLLWWVINCNCGQLAADDHCNNEGNKELKIFSVTVTLTDEEKLKRNSAICCYFAPLQ